MSTLMKPRPVIKNVSTKMTKSNSEIDKTPASTHKKRGRPSKKTNNKIITMPKLPESRVYSVGNSGHIGGIGMYMTTNIITLKLKKSDIERLERILDRESGMLLSNITEDFTPASWDPSLETSHTTKGDIENKTSFDDKKINQLNIMCRKSTGLKINDSRSSVERKDLIINSGIKRTNTDILYVYGESWPSSSPYACLYCCHTFNTTPIGIPHTFTNQVFICYGNFCSYNCAKRYLCPHKNDDDDMASLQTKTDIYVGDDHGEKMQLLEFLYHLETGTPMHESIKIAPSRLVLKMFGGKKTIEEYRRSFDTNTTYHTFKMPIVSMGYQIEECSDSKTDNSRRRLKNMSLDVAKLEKAYDDLMKTKKNNKKTVLQKMLEK